MKEEYTEYPCSGKKYNGEKAIISLTSWKARINTVSKTLFSLLKQCPGFHIVLALSADEFPNKEKELPDNLKVFIDNKFIEIIWISPDYKVFMKTFFTMDKYRNVPVISADDDCIYNCNYAKILYETWLKHQDCIITNDVHHTIKDYGPYKVSRGQNTLLTYNLMHKAIAQIKWIFNNDVNGKNFLLKHPEDDAYNAAYYYINNIKVFYLDLPKFYTFDKKIENTKTALHNRIPYKAKESIKWFEDLLRKTIVN